MEGLMIDPDPFYIDEDSNIIGYYIPQVYMFGKLLAIPGPVIFAKKNSKDLYVEDRIIFNFIRGDFWKTKRTEFGCNKFVVSLFICHDDIEVGNALNSHSGSN